MHPGQGPGLSLRDLGQSGGVEFVTLLTTEMPIHAHSFGRALAANGNSQSPVNNVWAQSPSGRGSLANYHEAPATGAVNSDAMSLAGGGLPHNNMMPYLTCNFNIALQGVFPPRS